MSNRKTFLEAVQRPESIDPAYCALLISQALNPGLNIKCHLNNLRTLGDEALSQQINCANTLLAFVNHQHNFRGNPDNYYKIENSMLDQVLETRMGIPVSLALVYMTIGNAAGLPVYGISFPGHFLIGVAATARFNTPQHEHYPKTLVAESDTLIDPFAARIVTRRQCYHLLDELYQRQVKESEDYFLPASETDLLIRLIENIKAIFLKQGSADLALTCLDYQLLISPQNPNLLYQQQQLLKHLEKRGGDSSVMH